MPCPPLQPTEPDAEGGTPIPPWAQRALGRLRPWSAKALTLVLLLWALLGISQIGTPVALALGGPQPVIDQPAPPFHLPTNTGSGTISLSDYRGKWVVVYFYPKDFTPGCTLEAQRFQKDQPQYLRRHAQVLGISADSVDSHAEFCDSEGLKFPLLADETGAVSQSYGSWLSGLSLRHTYVVDPEGLLRARFLGVNPVIHSQEVLEKLDELMAG
jgi:thioredoxin-dependent peroxiredoxin